MTEAVNLRSHNYCFRLLAVTWSDNFVKFYGKCPSCNKIARYNSNYCTSLSVCLLLFIGCCCFCCFIAHSNELKLSIERGRQLLSGCGDHEMPWVIRLPFESDESMLIDFQLVAARHANFLLLLQPMEYFSLNTNRHAHNYCGYTEEYSRINEPSAALHRTFSCKATVTELSAIVSSQSVVSSWFRKGSNQQKEKY